MKHHHPVASRTLTKGFTLVELLIVLAIIGLLAAILFPAFKGAQEKGYQANCASNLKQIYQAVQLYRQDEKAYPSSFAFLLPTDFLIGNPGGATATVEGQACTTAAQNCPNPSGANYFRGGNASLVCADDDTGAAFPRSSYGDISTSLSTGALDDMGRYTWNYWGYRKTNGTSCTATTVDFHECAGTAVSTSSAADIAAAYTSCTGTNPCPESVLPTAAYDAKKNPIKYSMSNRYAPTSTIITHCVYHRLPTASGKLASPEIYDPLNATTGAGARDLILRLDGSARLLDVSQFAANSNWGKQNW